MVTRHPGCERDTVSWEKFQDSREYEMTCDCHLRATELLFNVPVVAPPRLKWDPIQLLLVVERYCVVRIVNYKARLKGGG